MGELRARELFVHRLTALLPHRLIASSPHAVAMVRFTHSIVS